MRHPNQRGLFDHFLTGGWQAFAAKVAPEIDAEQDAAEHDDDARAFARCFTTPDGARVLDFLLARSIYRTTWDGREGVSIEQATAHGLMREGQNQMVALICAMIRRGLDVPRPGGASTSSDFHADEPAL